MRQKFTWTEHQLNKLNKAKDILAEFDEYKPLTLRQIYYQFVSKGFIENNVSQYTMLSTFLKNARIDGEIDWEDIEDRTRVFHNLSGFYDKESFIQQELDNFLIDYYRNLTQTQEQYIEVWIEKDALSSLFSKICYNYTVPVVVCKGFSSVSFLNNFKKRLDKQNKPSLMLYFGDFDPSGMEMMQSMEITLKNELNVSALKLKRVALTENDIFEFKLPHSPDALKRTDTRANKYLKLYGELAVELDALPPVILIKKIKDAIENELDIEKFNKEVEIEKTEFDILNKLKKDVQEFVEKCY